MIPLTVPKLSISMEEGKVLSWLVGDGERVSAGQPVVEIETDKATMEVEAPADGTIRIVADAGAVVGVESTIAQILAPGEEEAPGPPPAEEPALAAPSGDGAQQPVTRARKQVASPAARRLAQRLGVDLGGIAGSGPAGRIVAVDVERAAADAPAPAPEPTAIPDLRRAVVANIAASWREIPHIHPAGELAADGLVEARRVASGRPGDKVTVTDLLILVVTRALMDVPELNATLRADGGVDRADRVNLAVAVATADGLVAPVVRDAAELGLGAVARERARLVEAARAGALEKRDLGGATCTLSNLGGYPVDFFAPVVSGPQIAMVATGRIVEKPVAVEGMIAVRPRLWVNVAIDHRGADGEAGGRYLAALERRLTDLPRSI